MRIIKNGIYKNIDIDEYHKDQGISSTGIKLLLESPKKYHYQYISGNAKKETKALILGKALHLLALEPNLFENYFHVLPDGFTLHSNANKKIHSDLIKAGKTPIKIDDFEFASSMAYAIKHNKAFMNILNHKGNIEDSIYWKDEKGVLLRTRPDFYNDFVIVDLKSTDSASKEDFQKSILNNGYHIQAAMQIDGLFEHTKISRSYCYALVEKEPPFLTAVYMLDQTTIDLGREEYKKGAELYNECLTLDEWPGYSETIETISLPDWYLRKVA